jgi:hypothetical protein
VYSEQKGTITIRNSESTSARAPIATRRNQICPRMIRLGGEDLADFVGFGMWSAAGRIGRASEMRTRLLSLRSYF